MTIEPMDLRAARTRDALLGAFFSLVQEERYDEMTVADIVARAGVSRSAFYAHYAGKDALLAASIAGPFGVLARSLTADNRAALVGLLDHFWSNRALARVLFREPLRRRLARVLADRIEVLIEQGGAWKTGPWILPPRLVAIQLAESLLAPIIAWLAGESSCDSTSLATALRRTGPAVLAASLLPTARR